MSWACLGTLAALLSCYGPDVQSNHHAAIMPILARLLQADTQPRLRSRAVKCIVDFMAECTDDEAEMVDGYADGILNVLTEMVGFHPPRRPLFPQLMQPLLLFASPLCPRSSEAQNLTFSWCPQVVSGSVAHKLCAVSGISAVAVALGDRFTRFYAHLMPGFVQMLSTPPCDAESRELRGRVSLSCRLGCRL